MSEAKVLICGPIVGNSAESGDTWPFTTLEDVLSQLEWQKPYDSIQVTINSPSGRLDKAFGIYDKLHSLGPDITVTTPAQVAQLPCAVQR
ncbi:ATP-dependent Clp protease proteolytic subunit [Hymenobacter sp. AT01-02]|uniref:ATP-dependent Clp protease proteolytic subunit n=1 Tax=Hymenobacter sp. AT01-02 TaxID=1571877 RepID=UPI0005F130AF|nr:ATP-dependent Clp protease proteolytic subunit [Hymenobacter sp. AT01-02]